MIRVRFTSPDAEPIEAGPFRSVLLAPDTMGVDRASRTALYADIGGPLLVMIAISQLKGWLALPPPYTADGEDGGGIRCSDIQFLEVAG